MNFQSQGESLYKLFFNFITENFFTLKKQIYVKVPEKVTFLGFECIEVTKDSIYTTNKIGFVWRTIKDTSLKGLISLGSDFKGCHPPLFPEVYLDPSGASIMELFCENSQRLLAVSYFHKKAPLQMFHWVLNMHLLHTCTCLTFTELLD